MAHAGADRMPMSTAQKILSLLNRDALSVSELAARLGLSRNTAHVHVAKLEAFGAVEKVHRKATRRAGKPAFAYRTAGRHEDAFSAAYKPVLGSLVEALGSHLGPDERLALLDSAGRLMARGSGLVPTDDFDADLRKALDVVNALGAMAERSRDGEAPTVQCHTCPIGSLVHQEPSMCSLVASFFSEATSSPVTVRCRRGDAVVCGFSFATAEVDAGVGPKG